LSDDIAVKLRNDLAGAEFSHSIRNPF